MRERIRRGARACVRTYALTYGKKLCPMKIVAVDVKGKQENSPRVSADGERERVAKVGQARARGTPG